MLVKANLDYHLSCIINVDPRKTEVLNEMIAVQSAVYFEEVELVFEKIHKFEFPSFMHLSLDKERETAVSNYIKVFPAVINHHKTFLRLFKKALSGKIQVEWHDLRNDFLRRHRYDMEMLLRIHPKHQHMYGLITLREQEYQPSFVASETP